MFNNCPNCGQYHTDKIVDPKGPYAICPSCGYKHKFIQLPLFIITGASGSGKSSCCIKLSQTMKEVVVMESDILWSEEFNQPDSNYRRYREMWLRVSKNISQGGRPVVLCGTAVPEQFEYCVERRYFSQLHYLALVCEDDILRQRLKCRPAWRNSGSDGFIKEHIDFNNWLKQNAQKTTPPMTLLDTSHDSVDNSVVKIEKWIKSLIGK